MNSYPSLSPEALRLSKNFAIVERRGNKWKRLCVECEDDDMLLMLPPARKPDYSEGERYLVSFVTKQEVMNEFPGLELPAQEMSEPYCICVWREEIEVCDVICQSPNFPQNCVCNCDCSGAGSGGTVCHADCY